MTTIPQRHSGGWRQRLPALALASALGACASDPIIDNRGVDPAAYQADLADCRQYADEVSVAGNAAAGGLLGGAAGAAIGAAIGAVTGSPGMGAAVGAAGGGTSGAVGGGAHGVGKKDKIVRNCLRGRGYSVLD